MGQVAFDTQEFVETLEKEGLPKNQAKAISIAVRKSHEAVDIATKADIVEVNRNIADVGKDLSAEISNVRKDLSAEISDVRKDMATRFEKTDAQIADVRKDLSAEIADVRKDLSTEIANVRKDLSAEITLVRKDVEALTNSLLIKLSGVMLAIVGAAATIVTLIIKLV